jgi:hypothetical protein
MAKGSATRNRRRGSKTVVRRKEVAEEKKCTPTSEDAHTSNGDLDLCGTDILRSTDREVYAKQWLEAVRDDNIPPSRAVARLSGLASEEFDLRLKSALATERSPTVFLTSVYTDSSIPLRLRMDAAKALLAESVKRNALEVDTSAVRAAIAEMEEEDK